MSIKIPLWLTFILAVAGTAIIVTYFGWWAVPLYWIFIFRGFWLKPFWNWLRRP